MSYSETCEEVFHYFTDVEEEKIYTFLKERGYSSFEHNTVCGSCCGMYSDEIWVNGIGGKFFDKDKKALADYMEEEGISGLIDGYTVDANPDAYSAEYRINN